MDVSLSAPWVQRCAFSPARQANWFPERLEHHASSLFFSFKNEVVKRKRVFEDAYRRARPLKRSNERVDFKNPSLEQHVFARSCCSGGCIDGPTAVFNMIRAISRIVAATGQTTRAVRPPVIHQSTLQRSARAWSRPLSTSDGEDADARATDDYAPADDATNVVDEDAPAPLLTPKQRGISKKAPPLSEKQKKKLAAQWADYVEYMDHQRTQGWKT